MEREVEVEWVDLLGFITRLGPDRAYISSELEYPLVVGVKWGERVHEAGEEIRKGYAATWASWREEVGIHRVDCGWRSGWKGAKDVGVFDGVGCYQHERNLVQVNS